MTNEELIHLNEISHKIIDSDLDWKDKYDMIFSENMSRKVHLDYYDPDTSYEEDTLAWVDAFDKFIIKYKTINNYDKN